MHELQVKPMDFRALLTVSCWRVVLLSLGLSPGAWTQAAEVTNNPGLTVDRIFDSEDFKPESLGTIVWRKNGSGYYRMEKVDVGGDGKSLVLNDPVTGKKDVIVPAHAFAQPNGGGALAVEEFEFSEDESKLLLYTNSKRVWRRNTRGDYWVMDVTTRELRKLGGDAAPASLMFAEFSPDGEHVAYVRDHNVYVQELRDLTVTPLSTDGSKSVINGTFDWVYEEELDLRDGFRWSPDGTQIAYWQLDSAGVREFQLLNNTDSFYPRALPIPYPKTGEQNSAARIGVVRVDGGKTTWMNIPGDPRNHYLARMDWASNSTELVVQQFNRLQNTNRVMLVDANSGQSRLILTESDSAWVDNNNPARWLNGGKEFLWLSETDGWRHAYRVNRGGDRVSRITQGNFDLMEIEAVDEKGGWLYYLASPENPTQRYLYRVRLGGGSPERVTPADAGGTHSYNISPDAQWAIHTYSNFTNPPVTTLIRLPEHKELRVLVDNQKLFQAWNALNKPRAEFFRVDIGENVSLDGWMIKPPDFDPGKKYPVLVYVYGEPAGVTVVDAWRGNQLLWHSMLAQEGYIVMSIENRGTPAPRGREWRKVVYRQVGILAPEDQAKGVRAACERWSWLDSEKIGVWGWSGGGSMTLNAIFKHPDLYKVGISVAPVPNQRYYDTIYQERYMGLPDDNSDGYRRGSPIHFAHQLKGKLLVVHGTGDDNVHYQGVEALINELVAHNKQFSMMAYPNRSHSISEGKNTTRHLYTLLTEFLKRHLPATSMGDSATKPPSIATATGASDQ